jgi:hypothetical protein
MMAKFSFFAYGILAVAAFCFALYVWVNMPQSGVENPEEIGQPLLYLGIFISVMFVIYMFAKLAKR